MVALQHKHLHYGPYLESYKLLLNTWLKSNWHKPRPLIYHHLFCSFVLLICIICKSSFYRLVLGFLEKLKNYVKQHWCNMSVNSHKAEPDGYFKHLVAVGQSALLQAFHIQARRDHWGWGVYGTIFEECLDPTDCCSWLYFLIQFVHRWSFQNISLLIHNKDGI